MARNRVTDLDVHRPQSRRENLTGVRLQNIQAVKEKLLEEMVELESKMEKLRGSIDPANLSMMQTYREMIHGRKAFFNTLNR